jgi:hypothetical protein
MIYSKQANELMKQKYNYWRKVLSDEAIEENIITTLRMYSYYRTLYDLSIFDSVYSSIFMSLTYGIPMGEISTFNLCYDTDFPSPEEFAQGKLLHIEQVNCLDKYPGMGYWLSDLIHYMQSHFGPLLPPITLPKGYFDKTYYGYSYYDPEPVRYFLRSTSLKESKRSTSGRGYAEIFKSITTALDMDYEAVDKTYTYLRAFDRAKFESSLSEYSWTDKTRVQTEEEGKIPIPTEDLEGKKKEIRAYSLGNLWLDLLAETQQVDITPIVKDGLPPVEGVVDPSKRADIAIADIIAREQKTRLMYMPLLVANYQTAEERKNPHASRRTDTYGVGRAIYYNIKEIIDIELRNLPKFVKNQYNVAVQQLFSRLTRDGGWGYETYRSMTVEELKTQWIEEWTGKGLDRSILENLFDKAMQAIKFYGPQRLAAKLTQIAMYSR